MDKRLFAVALFCPLMGLAGLALRAEAGIEAKSLEVQPGDTLTINSDFGKIRIRSWEGAILEIKFQNAAPDDARKGTPGVTLRRSGSTIVLQTSSAGGPGEAVDFEIKAPRFMNVTVSGSNPDISIGGIQGQVRVQVSAGRITAEDLIAVTSLMTDSGDIFFRTSVQPQGDVRLESTSGNINCELTSQLNLHGWIRAGGKISWDMDAMVEATSLEKQLGTSGPLLYAGSLKGNVVVRLRPGPLGVAAAASSQAGTAGSAIQKPTEPVPPAAGARTEPSRKNPELVRETLQPKQQQIPVPTAAPAASEARQEPDSKAGQPPVVLQSGYALKVDVDSVFLNVSVRDGSTNRAVAGLQKDDFRIFEDGIEQDIDQMLPSEAPFSLLLLIDTSGSTRSYLHLMKQAAIDFTRQIKANDRIAVATFNSNVQLVENFTSDRSAAEKAIQKISSGGGTAFYDALATCLNRYMRGVEGRKAIVVFTDGIDNQLQGRGGQGSRTTFDELYRQVQESDTIIYTIFLDTEADMQTVTRYPGRSPGGIGGWPGGRRRGGFPMPLPGPGSYPMPPPGPGSYPRGRVDETAIYEEARSQLSDVAEQTGGRMYSPRKIGELAGVYTQIADDLRIQYQLAYNSRNGAHDGKWREIRVEVENRPEAVVRTRRGYYARSSSSG